MGNLNTIFGGDKLSKHSDRIATWLAGGVPPPVTMEFDISGRCNHHCPQCSGLYRCSDMETSVACDYLQQLADYGACAVTFTGGGEPLMHPQCVSLVAAAKCRDLDVGFISNGTLLTQQSAAERLALCCSWSRISIDAGDSATYAAVHNVSAGEFFLAWDAVWLLANARDMLGSECTVGVGYLLDARTAPGMHKATIMARECGADYIQFRPFHRDHFAPHPDAIAQCQAEARGPFHVLTSQQKYSRMTSEREYVSCHGAFFTGVIQADSNVPLCCHLRGDPRWYIGNLREQSFKAIWESARKRTLVDTRNVQHCLPLCRHDANNQVLEQRKSPVCHENFL